MPATSIAAAIHRRRRYSELRTRRQAVVRRSTLRHALEYLLPRSELRTNQEREVFVDAACAGATRPAVQHHPLRAHHIRFDVANLLCGQLAAEDVEVRFV